MSNDRWHWRTALGRRSRDWRPSVWPASWSRPARRPALCPLPQRPPARRRPRRRARPRAIPVGGRIRVGERRGCGTRLRDRAGQAQRLLRDRLRPAVQAVRGVHQAVPERDLGHQPGPVRESHHRRRPAAVRRQPARPDPPADAWSRWSRTACSRTSTTTRRRSAGTSGRPPSSRRTGSATDGTRGVGLAVRHGPQLQPDRRLLQQEAGRPDRHDRAADDGRRVRRPARRRRRTPGLTPIMAVERRRERRRPGVPAPEPDGRLRSDRTRSTTGSSRSRAPPSTRRPTSRPPSTCSSGSRTATSRRTSTRSSTPTPTRRFGEGEGVFIFNGDWQNAGYDKEMPGKVGFFLMPPAEAGGTPAAMSAPLTYGIAANAKHADCAAFFLNWVATNPTGAPDRRRGRRLEPGRPGRPDDARRSRQGSVTNETLAAGADGRQGQRRDGLHRQRDRGDLRPGLDAGAPEDGRREAGRRPGC